MKTKIFYPLVLVLGMMLAFTCPSYAQLEAGLGFGYNFAAGGGRLGTNNTSTYDYTGSGTAYNTSQKGVYGSWGQGMDIDGYIEDMICECFGAGLDLSYQKGKKFKYNDNTTNIYSAYTSTNMEDYTGSYNAFTINPYIKVQCCEYFGIKPYGRIGLDLNLMNTMKQSYTETETSPSGTDIYDEKAKLKGKLNLGLDAAAGFKYDLGNSFKLFGELDYKTRSFTPDMWTLTKYSENGVDKLSTLNTSQKETEYTKDYTSSSTATVDPNAPAKSLTYKAPASSWGLKIGVAYDFGGSPKAKEPTEHR